MPFNPNTSYLIIFLSTDKLFKMLTFRLTSLQIVTNYKLSKLNSAFFPFWNYLTRSKAKWSPPKSNVFLSVLVAFIASQSKCMISSKICCFKAYWKLQFFWKLSILYLSIKALNEFPGVFSHHLFSLTKFTIL